MKRPFIPLAVLLQAFALWLLPMSASALIVSGSGSRPVRDAGWPEGALAVANLQSRLGWFEGPPFGGGEWHFFYSGDTAAFIAALDAFAAIRAPSLDLEIQDGPGSENSILHLQRVDWTFCVWVPAAWNRLYNNPKFPMLAVREGRFHKPVDPPCLTVYVGRGGVDWAQITVPPQVHVRDARASASGVDLSGGSVFQAEFFDMDTGKPIEGAHIIVDRMTWQNPPASRWKAERLVDRVSDESGRVRIEKIPVGDFQTWVHVTAEGYAPLMLDQHSLLHPVYTKYTVELAKAARLSGVVTDPEGKPIKGAKVHPLEVMASNGRSYDNGQQFETYDKSTVETDEAGRFEIANLPTGYAMLTVAAPGYAFGDASTIHDVPGDIELRLSRPGGIQGNVLDESGNALTNYQGHLMVRIAPKNSKTPSAGGTAGVKADGTFDFNNFPPGEYRLTLDIHPFRGRRSTQDQIVTVEPGARATVTLVLDQQ